VLDELEVIYHFRLAGGEHDFRLHIASLIAP
jgi:hypothetical protein